VIVHVYRPHPSWLLAVLIPGFELPTREARKAIPKRIAHADAVFNLTRLPFVIDSIVDGDADVLHRVMDDRLHEPYRKRFIEGFDRIRVAGLRAGSPAVYLSGAGPTIAAFCQGGPAAERVRKAMSRAAAFDPNHQALVLRPHLKGAQIKPLG
jgi:homoserine kinase